jgi:phytoene desaturase
MQSRTAIVIGSGIAGMATAIRLAIAGFDVQIFEKNNTAGGKLTSFEKQGYHFDGGPSLFTQPSNLEDLFELAGEPIEKYFSYQPCEIACNYFFENGKKITAWANKELFAEELKLKTGEDSTQTKTYLQSSEILYNSIGKIFLNNSLHKKRTWLNKRVFPALRSLRIPYLLSTLDQYNRKEFKSAEARQLFNRYATYNGSNPYKAPAMLSVIPHLEHNQGTYYPRGGMITIARALHQLAEKLGVRFNFNSPVQRIIEAEGVSRGVVVNGRNIFSDLVVSNIDVYFTYKLLLHNYQKATAVLKQERSSSACIFYWGIKKEFKTLGLHNILFSADYKKEFTHIFSEKTLYHDPTVYINITSKYDRQHSPDGSENWFVMVNAPANCGQDWEALKFQARENIVNKLNRMLGVNISDFIETEETLDPVSIERGSGSYMGSLYGTSSNSRIAAFMRHPNFSKEIKNLYFCGGSVHPGGGIPLCFNSAKIVCELIIRDFEKKHH